jgi:hypothetical protein
LDDENAARLAAEIAGDLGVFAFGEEVLFVVGDGAEGTDVGLGGFCRSIVVPVLEVVVVLLVSGMEVAGDVDLVINEGLEEKLEGAGEARVVVGEDGGPEGGGLGEIIGEMDAAGVADDSTGDGEHRQGDADGVEVERLGDCGCEIAQGGWEGVEGESGLPIANCGSTELAEVQLPID